MHQLRINRCTQVGLLSHSGVSSMADLLITEGSYSSFLSVPTVYPHGVLVAIWCHVALDNLLRVPTAYRRLNYIMMMRLVFLVGTLLDGWEEFPGF